MLLEGGDTITVPIKPSNTIQIKVEGEVLYPGIYTVSKGARVSDLLTAAGGLTTLAYPYGSIFTRESVRVTQQKSFDDAAIRLKQSILRSQTQGTSIGSEPVDLGAVFALLEDLDTVVALGRIEVEVDPTVLLVRRELDISLRKGDRIFIPERPAIVSVIGEVLNPGARMFQSGMRSDDYLKASGGITDSADPDNIFVIMPNGKTQRLSLSVWNYNPIFLPPGSTIIVPLDTEPLNYLIAMKDITSILSQVAVTLATLTILSGQ